MHARILRKHFKMQKYCFYLTCASLSKKIGPRYTNGSFSYSSDHDSKIHGLIIRRNVYDHYKVIDSELKYSQPILEYIYKTLLFAKNNDIYQNSPKSRENEKNTSRSTQTHMQRLHLLQGHFKQP